MVRSALVVLAILLPRALQAQRIELVRELVIGADPASPDYEFAAIGAVAASASGTLYVGAWDGGVTQIRKFDRAGRYRGVVGREGAGPGEYRAISGMALIGDSLVAVLDPLNGGRVSLFDTTGTFRSSFQQQGALTMPGQMFAAWDDGLLAVRTRTVPPDPDAPLTSVFVRMRANGRIVDSLSLPAEAIGGGHMYHRSLGARWPFLLRPVYALLPGGRLATANTAAYRIDVVSRDGRRAVIERNAAPVRFQDGEREEWETLTSMGGRSAPTIPRQKPLIRELVADDAGRLWVSLYTAAVRRIYPQPPGSERHPTMSWFEPNAYDVFGADQAYLGRVELRRSPSWSACGVIRCG